MKTITFKTLSILLAAVILVAALPVIAFAEDVSPCVVYPCEHNVKVFDEYSHTWASNEFHYTLWIQVERCTLCEKIFDVWEVDYVLNGHCFDDSVDPEYDMQGVCSDCGEMIYW